MSASVKHKILIVPDEVASGAESVVVGALTPLIHNLTLGIYDIPDMALVGLDDGVHGSCSIGWLNLARPAGLEPTFPSGGAWRPLAISDRFDPIRRRPLMGDDTSLMKTLPLGSDRA